MVCCVPLLRLHAWSLQHALCRLRFGCVEKVVTVRRFVNTVCAFAVRRLLQVVSYLGLLLLAAALQRTIWLSFVVDMYNSSNQHLHQQR